DKISNRIDALQRKGLEVRKQAGKVVADNLKYRIKKSQLEDCKTIGLNLSEVIDNPNWYTVAEMLVSKKGIEETCLVSNEDFSFQVNAKLNGQLDRFLEKYREVISETPFSGLKEHVEGVKSAVNQKKQQVNSYRQALMENEETNLSSSESNQQYGHQQASSLDNSTCVVSGKVDCYWKSIGIKFGPQIHLEGGGTSSFNLGLTVSFDPSNTSREDGIAVALSANKKNLETGVESRLSRKGSEHTVTAQVNGSSGLSAGIEIQNNSFQDFLNSSSVINGGRVVVGCKLDTGRVEGKMQFCVLPFKTLKKWVTSNSDQTDFNSNTLTSNDQNKIEFVLRQEESQFDFPLNEVQSTEHHENENEQGTKLAEAEKKSIEKGENAEILENQDRRITSFAEARA
ncbi:MAG: hypothetical protein ACRDL7_09970, partial [Gaiellaceae bacterium]